MTLKEIVQWSGKSRQEICKQAEIPYSTLADLINGRKDILCAKTKTFVKIAKALGLTMEELYRMLEEYQCSLGYAEHICQLKTSEYHISVDVYMYGIEYYVAFSHNGQTYSFELCKAMKENTQCLRDIASFIVDDFIIDLIMGKEVIKCSIL
ncbi:MAG: helix-turn-helix transcriptional regulator [Clostridiales bacterium]|nr:helix-turn-helix transcriptional regulator [Eubacterium sp.]MDD7348322.1 helix-turn-helix transcriptional regulator [Clostridiales bacterium]